ncbi:MAG: hypothetical protein ACRD0O_17025, partial [Acidimicrobiia bacterium]
AVGTAAPGAGAQTAPLCPPGRAGALPSGMGETSGITASGRFPEWGWVIRDSGHPPSLYAVRFLAGGRSVVREIRVAGADNTDWEDIAYARNRDGTGRLYVVESGQTGRDHYIYKIPEADPLGPKRSVGFRRYRYAYPRGRHFNTEAAFFHQGRLVLVTKTSPARVYRFEGFLSSRRVNRPRFVGVLRGARTVSVTRVSPDGRVLVAANHNRLYVYRSAIPSADLSQFVARRPDHSELVGRGDNIEAGDFFPFRRCTLLLAAESKNIYRLAPGG